MLVIASLILRLTLADRVFPLNYNLYIPVALLLPAGILFSLAAKGKLSIRGGMALLILALSIPSFLREQPNLFGAREKPSAANTSRLMSYNVMAYAISEEGIVNTVREHDPDVLCVVEGTFGTWAPQPLVKGLGDKYKWALGNRLSVASRLPILEEGQPVKGKEFAVLRVVVETPSGPVAIYTLDMNPPVRRRDGPAFAALEKMLAEESHPAIVVGDYNVPRSSVHLSRAMKGWNDAFRAAGANRYLATWPSPVPLWQIDHAYYAGEIEVTRATIPRSLASDHRPLVLEFRRSDDKPISP